GRRATAAEPRGQAAGLAPGVAGPGNPGGSTPGSDRAGNRGGRRTTAPPGSLIARMSRKEQVKGNTPHPPRVFVFRGITKNHMNQCPNLHWPREIGTSALRAFRIEDVAGDSIRSTVFAGVGIKTQCPFVPLFPVLAFPEPMAVFLVPALSAIERKLIWSHPGL